MANLILDRQLRRATLHNHEIHLSDLEFEILWVLSAFTGIPLSLERLTGHLHDNDIEADHQQIQPCLAALQSKLQHSRRLGLDNGHVVLF